MQWGWPVHRLPAPAIVCLFSVSEALPLRAACACCPQLQQLQAAVQELLTARHGAQLHAAVLQELKGSYQVGDCWGHGVGLQVGG